MSGKKGENWKNCHFSSNIRGNHSNYHPERIEAPPFLHVLDLNSPSSYVKCPRKCQKTYNFLTLSQMKFTPLHLLNFGMNPKLDHIPVCILLKLDNAKFGVSSLFFLKLSKKKFRGDRLTPPSPLPLVKEGLNSGSSGICKHTPKCRARPRCLSHLFS